MSKLCSADHRRGSRSLTAALRPSADVAALLRTRTRGLGRESGELFLPGLCRWRLDRSGILPPTSRACPCEYAARRPPHRRWVQETQPHTCGCAGRILTAEFQSAAGLYRANNGRMLVTCPRLHRSPPYRLSATFVHSPSKFASRRNSEVSLTIVHCPAGPSLGSKHSMLLDPIPPAT